MAAGAKVVHAVVEHEAANAFLLVLLFERFALLVRSCVRSFASLLFLFKNRRGGQYIGLPNQLRENLTRP